MFTGIVTDVGKVRSLQRSGDTRIELSTAFDMSTVDIGASICCSGACLTVIEKGTSWFAVSASSETLEKTTIGAWQEGTSVNLERALKLGDELGGHIVSGHVDGVGRLMDRSPDGASIRMEFEAPPALEKFIAAKGSVTIDGVSLTVNTVDGRSFSVNIIPHTAEETTLGDLEPGHSVNLEIDMLARYVARLLEKD